MSTFHPAASSLANFNDTIKAPTNNTYTDSTIPIHALTTIQLFAKQIMLLKDFPGSSDTDDRSGEQTRLFVKTSSFACLHAGLSLSLRGSSAGVSYALLFWASVTQVPRGHAAACTCWAWDKARLVWIVSQWRGTLHLRILSFSLPRRTG